MGNDEKWEWSSLSSSRDESRPSSLSDEGGQRTHEEVSVVGLGALCDLRETSEDGRSVSFSVDEFALLEDGRRVVLRNLGFTIGMGSRDPGAPEVWKTYPTETITQDVLNVVLPDDDDSGEDHPWEWLASLARERGLMVTAEDLRALPYRVHLADGVLRLGEG